MKALNWKLFIIPAVLVFLLPLVCDAATLKTGAPADKKKGVVVEQGVRAENRSKGLVRVVRVYISRSAFPGVAVAGTLQQGVSYDINCEIENVSASANVVTNPATGLPWVHWVLHLDSGKIEIPQGGRKTVRIKPSQRISDGRDRLFEPGDHWLSCNAAVASLDGWGPVFGKSTGINFTVSPAPR